MTDAERKYRELRRTQIIQELGALEDLMIALGELKERTIVPRRKQEYFEGVSTTYTTLKPSDKITYTG
ncbi:MAG: hypothetical protein WC714_28910 [Candidatus Obscuribacterales bacterium]